MLPSVPTYSRSGRYRRLENLPGASCSLCGHVCRSRPIARHPAARRPRVGHPCSIRTMESASAPVNQAEAERVHEIFSICARTDTLAQAESIALRGPRGLPDAAATRFALVQVRNIAWLIIGRQHLNTAHELILVGGALGLLSILAGVISARFHAPLLLVFLALGMLAGEDGPGGIVFNDFQSSYLRRGANPWQA
jgi:hypothetical protein